MTQDPEHKEIPVGTRTDNTCCVCCDNCYDVKPGLIWELDTSMKCQDIAGPDGEHVEGECYPIYTGLCPASCCACPPTGALCMTLTTLGACPVIDGSEFRLTVRPYGVDICSGFNPHGGGGPHGGSDFEECYRGGTPYADMTLQNGIQMYNNDWEKWGWSGTMCDGIYWPGCEDELGVPIPTRGEHLMISLCCCDVPNTEILATEEDPIDCHACSYRLNFWWLDNNPDPGIYEFCTCPNDGYEAQLIPAATDEIPPIFQPSIDLWMTAGQCLTGNPSPDTPFILLYEMPDLWWNCDCCMNGDGFDDNTVPIYAVITEVDPDDPEDCENTWEPGFPPGDMP